MTDQPTLQPVVNPREHCGDLPPSLFGAPRTECVLRPDHSGSHADGRGGRWWIDPTAPQTPASAPVTVQDAPGDPGRPTVAPETPQTAVERLRTQAAAQLVRDQAALAQVRLLIGAYRPRLRLADPILLAKLEQAVAQVGELEPAEAGEGQ